MSMATKIGRMVTYLYIFTTRVPVALKLNRIVI